MNQTEIWLFASLSISYGRALIEKTSVLDFWLKSELKILVKFKIAEWVQVSVPELVLYSGCWRDAACPKLQAYKIG